MSVTAVTCEGLSKRYRLGQINHAKTLRESLSDVMTKPLHLLTQMSRVRQKPVPSADAYFWALKDVSFEIPQGEVVGVIGRNGAGKSTLLKILSRITKPTEGEINIRGRIGSLLEVGTGFHPELTGRENIYLNGAILGMPRADIAHNFDAIVDFAEIGKFLDTPVKRYSSGMYVRLAFAVAAHLSPEILIVDEVLAVGDASFQKKCLGKMGEVARGGRTVLFVSHNMAAIKRLCTSAMRLSNGQLLEKGETDAVVGAYLEDSLGTDAKAELPDPVHLVKSPLQIRDVEVLNSKRAPSGVILFGEEIHIKLSVQARESVKHARVGIGVYAEGVRISTIHTLPVDFPASYKLYDLTCSIPGNTLLPNFYSLHVGAYSAELGRGLDWVPDAVSFRIEPVSAQGGDDYDEKDFGLVVLKSTWEGSLLNSGGGAENEPDPLMFTAS